MGLSRTVSETNGDFGRKSQIFPTSVFYARVEVVPALGVKNWGYRAAKDV